MYILGISCHYHDAAACLIKDGKIIGAVQEERFSRIKHDPSFPAKAINYLLNEAKINLSDIDVVSYYDDPVLKFQRILKTYFKFFPKSFRLILNSLPIWLLKKIHWKKGIQKEFQKNFNFSIPEHKIENIPHHHSHAASAFLPSPFEEAAVLVVDGVGEFATTSIWVGENNKLKQIEQINFPNSLGLLYSSFTSYTGFKVNSGEYKVMGLAPYGKPAYSETIKKNLIELKEDGSFKLNMKFFSFPYSKYMTNRKFHKLFNSSPRERESELTQREMDLASSIQDITEEAMLRLAKRAKELTGKENLCLAGGVALNCVANGKILRSKLFKDIWIQPAAGDAGGALGCALSHYHEKLNHPRVIESDDSMNGSYLGPQFNKEEIKNYLDKINAKYEIIEDEKQLTTIVSDSLVQQDVVGWHCGRMEFGPRALGARSILGDPRSDKMQKIMNLKIKYRESFRPFAPSVLEEDAKNYFNLDGKSPYMLIVTDVNPKIRLSTPEEKNLTGITKLQVKRSELPAITHVDYSARVQTVGKKFNRKYYQLLNAFKEKTGTGVLINTSFNVRGEPIVCTPEDSYRCFMRTEMDMLVINDFVLRKKDQPNFEDTTKWQKEFELD